MGETRLLRNPPAPGIGVGSSQSSTFPAYLRLAALCLLLLLYATIGIRPTNYTRSTKGKMHRRAYGRSAALAAEKKTGNCCPLLSDSALKPAFLARRDQIARIRVRLNR